MTLWHALQIAGDIFDECPCQFGTDRYGVPCVSAGQALFSGSDSTPGGGSCADIRRLRDGIMDGMQRIVEAEADSGNRRILGAPWELWRSTADDDRDGLIRGLHQDVVSRWLSTRSNLTDDEEQMHLAVHEVGHAFAMHATGMAYGNIVIPHPSEPRDGQTRFYQRAFAERRELPRTAREAAMLTLGGWVAATVWMRSTTTADGRLLSDDPLNICDAQMMALDDHYQLMCFVTDPLTVYLYGDVQPPKGWEHDVITVDTIAQELDGMLTSRWARVMDLTQSVQRDGHASMEAITQTLGTPGWAEATTAGDWVAGGQE